LSLFGWTPGIGDPTIYGWIAVAAYAVGTLCCAWASTKAPKRERRFWLALALIMAFLGANKQLDLQTLFTDAAKVEAKRQGWYFERHRYQLIFILSLAAASTAAVILLLKRASRASGPTRGAIVGLASLLLFVLVRASSFHKVDWFIGLHLGGIRANHLLELGGIALVTGFAFAATRKNGRRRAA
jgi:hypothetical protein